MTESTLDRVHRSAQDCNVTLLHGWYRSALALTFALFNSARLLSYLPTIWAIYANGDSSQHSLWTWVWWCGANLTMAAWVYEQNGRRYDCVMAVAAGNALMCAATIMLIVWYRIGGAS